MQPKPLNKPGEVASVSNPIHLSPGAAWLLGSQVIVVPSGPPTPPLPSAPHKHATLGRGCYHRIVQKKHKSWR